MTDRHASARRPLRLAVHVAAVISTIVSAASSAAAAASASASAAAAASASASAADPDNAATWYRQVGEAIDAVDSQARLIVADWDRTSRPTRALRGALRAHARVLELAERGAGCRFCDFELPYDQGWEILLPHLSQLRTAQRTLSARAAIAIHENRPTAATADIERIQTIALHLANDQIVISSLVSMAGANMADALVQMGFRRGVFGPAEAADLLGSTRGLAAPGAFQLRGAVAMERAINADWLRDRLVNGDEHERGQLMAMLMGQGDGAEAYESGSAMETEMIVSELDLLDASFASIDNAFATMYEDPEGAKAEFDEWAEELQSGEYGELSKSIVPAFGKVMDSGIRLHDQMTSREAMLRGVIRGDVGAVRLDGAVHLREAIAHAGEITDEIAELITLGAGILGGDEEDQDAAAKSWELALSQLRSAAEGDGFDDGVLLVDGDSLVLPAWVGGTRRTLAMLSGAVSERLDADAPDEAARLALVGLRVARHLTTSRSITAAMVAQEHVRTLTGLIETMPESVRSDDTIWSEFVAAGEGFRMQPTTIDGFPILDDVRLGYPRHRTRMIELATQAVFDLRARVDGTAPTWAPGDAEVNALDIEQSVILLLATERVAGAMYGPIAEPLVDPAADDDAGTTGPPPTDRLPRIEGLDGLVDADRLVGLEARIPGIRRALVAREATVAEIIGPDASPLDLRPRSRQAGDIIRALHHAIDAERRWGAGPSDADASADG